MTTSVLPKSGEAFEKRALGYRQHALGSWFVSELSAPVILDEVDRPRFSTTTLSPEIATVSCFM